MSKFKKKMYQQIKPNPWILLYYNIELSVKYRYSKNRLGKRTK